MLFKALEALAMGKPTVGYRESFRGIPDGDPRAFISVDSDDEMVESILSLLDNASARQSLAARARAHAEANLSWEYGATLLANSAVLRD
jgi:glycosyltransferase involved in cell wall biosynthesis